MANAASTAAGITNTLDDMGKPAWIALLVLTFILFWPLGLALLAYMIWSGRMGCSGNRRWRERMREGMHRWHAREEHGSNSAFDDYRQETLKRLEEEEREFRAFLDRLRRAKDKAEFDEFMAERKRRPEPPSDGAPAAA